MDSQNDLHHYRTLETTESRWNSLAEQDGNQVVSFILWIKNGESGFGAVWIAEESETISRLGTIQVVKPEEDTTEVLTLFETERRQLVTHSIIARALSALIDPAKLDTLQSDRAANPRLRKACYWLHVAKMDEFPQLLLSMLQGTPGRHADKWRRSRSYGISPSWSGSDASYLTI